MMIKNNFTDEIDSNDLLELKTILNSYIKNFKSYIKIWMLIKLFQIRTVLCVQVF